MDAKSMFMAIKFQKISSLYFCIGLLANMHISFAQPEEIKPYLNIEDADLEVHVSSLVYLRDLITLEGDADTSGKVNFAFLSGNDYIIDGKLNIDLVSDTLGIADPSYLDAYSDLKENCLILTLNGVGNHVTTLAINGTSGRANEEDYKCSVVALLKFEGIETAPDDYTSAKDISLKLINHYLRKIAP